MSFAIEVLQQAVKTVKSNLYLLEKSKARDLETAAEFEATAASAMETGEHSTNAARGCRNSAAWIEGRAIPAERRKLAELEEALSVLRNRAPQPAAALGGSR